MIIKKRHFFQWLLLLLVFVVVGLGWKYPLLALVVPIVMFAGIIGVFFYGRYVCGHYCPRGAFYDRIVAHMSFGRQIPVFFRNRLFR